MPEPLGDDPASAGESVLGSHASPADRLNHLFSITYEELKRIASWVRRNDPSATLNPTALVNEAWMKLSKTPQVAHLEHLHFKRIACRAMRQVLIDAARRRKATKRANVVAIPDWEGLDFNAAAYEDQVTALDQALVELSAIHPRPAEIVEARFFGGLESAEIAAMMNISESTVTRDWRLARAWLSTRINKTGV